MIGIVKSKTLKSGAVGEFWKITKVSMDLLTGKLIVTLSLYITQAGYVSGNSPLSMSKVYELSISPSDIASGDIRDTIWTKVKAKAAQVVTIDISGATLGSPTVFDPDINGGTDV